MKVRGTADVGQGRKIAELTPWCETAWLIGWFVGRKRSEARRRERCVYLAGVWTVGRNEQQRATLERRSWARREREAVTGVAAVQQC